MRWLWWTSTWRSLTRRLPARLALVCYVFAAIGLPLPAFPGKAVGQPFPCQDHPCGCRTAEQCWRHCCCSSVEEHWAWARANHIEPPSYATRPADEGWNTTPLHDQANGQPASEDHSCCHTTADHDTTTQDTSGPEAEKEATPPVGTRWLSSAATLRCHGAGALWLSGGAQVPPPPLVTWSPVQVLVDQLSYLDHLAAQLPSCPLDPPPRLSAA
jgi:hypothetical protein